MNDVISRQAAILQLSHNKCGNDENDIAVQHDIETIRALPSSQPERKTGKWIFKKTFPNDDSEFPMGCLICSECGSQHSNATPCNFCDN